MFNERYANYLAIMKTFSDETFACYCDKDAGHTMEYTSIGLFLNAIFEGLKKKNEKNNNLGIKKILK